MDDPDALTSSPEGFLKMQIGWTAEEVHFYCIACGVPA